MNTCLIIILILGTLVIVFQNNFVVFMFRKLHLSHFFDWINLLFLNKIERECLLRISGLKRESQESLKEQCDNIIKKYAGKFSDNRPAMEKLVKFTPVEIQSFFQHYDFIHFENNYILDIKYIRRIKIDDLFYIVIGKDDEEDALYIVEEKEIPNEQSEIYMIDKCINSKENIEINIKKGKGYSSLYLFVCTMYTYYQENCKCNASGANIHPGPK